MNQNQFGGTEQEAERIAYLVAGFINKTITEPEHEELDDWINASDKNMQLFEELTDERNIAANREWMQMVDTEQSFNRLKDQGVFDVPPKFNKRIIWWAAAVAVPLGVGLFFVLQTGINTPASKDIADTDTLIIPGGNKATLIVEGNKKLLLDANAKAMEGTDSGYRAVIEKGSITYTSKGVGTSWKHILSTPLGGQYLLKLSDGTSVWLNALSQLEFPVTFPGGERTVRLTGEAYFEVAPNPAKPFKVMLNDSAIVTVLGTHFNINSYTDEANTEITLVEGSVKVSKGTKEVRLSPGMHAAIKSNSITIEEISNTKTATGWKEGNFVFVNTPIEEIMLQVGRWYNCNVVYKEKVTGHFNGTIGRTEPLTRLLDLLEGTGQVHFKIEKQTVYVYP